MKILSVTSLPIPDLKIIRFGRFPDPRGYFSEPYRRSDLAGALPELAGIPFVQTNESRSRDGVLRGLHFQWNPFMGKLVRTLAGRMLDIALDIRPDSPTRGRAALHDMPARADEDWDEWIWVPPGFAHGNLFLADTRIEYLCTGEYSQGCEAGISPFAPDLDWSLANPGLKALLDGRAGDCLVTDKDRRGPSLGQWLADPRAGVFRNLCRGGARPGEEK